MSKTAVADKEMTYAKRIGLVVMVVGFTWMIQASAIEPPAHPDQPAGTAQVMTLETVDALYASGNIPLAWVGYQQLLKSDAPSARARAGFIRCALTMEQVDQAYAAVQEGLAAEPKSAVLHGLLGKVQFRRGEMAQAEEEYKEALKLNINEPEALVGLAELLSSYSLRGKAYKLIVAAHKAAPEHPDVRKAWIGLLRRKARIDALEAYLSSPKPDDGATTHSLERSLTALKATMDGTAHACRPAGTIERGEVPMEKMLYDPTRLLGYGLQVKINDRTSRLQIDTGASGLMVGSKAAEKSGVVKLYETEFGGIGDEGATSGYVGYAEHVQIGAFEFTDCLVYVSDKKTVVGSDGLIGMDLFARYLVDLDMPGGKLKLDPLPKLPDGEVTAAEGDCAANQTYPELICPPRDRYVAPEMQDWNKVFRFGHSMLIFTGIKDKDRVALFLIDTGGFGNILSTNFAKAIGKMGRDDANIRGISGKVKEVYRTNKADLIFGGLLQKSQDIVTFDLSRLSSRYGTEIGGILGFTTLKLLDIKIDYRDGLVKLTYDPNRALYPVSRWTAH